MGESRTRLDGLNLVVASMDASLAFYRRLGVEIPDDAVWKTETGIHHVALEMPGGVGLDFDSPELARAYNAGFEDGAAEARTLVGFRVETREAVDERYADLTAAGHPGLQPPYDAFWGARYAIVADPDGRPVGIMSPSDPERRSRPPQV